MFDLTMAWWEFPARAALIYLVLLLMVRLSGKRTVGQFTPFDLLVVMLLSEAVSNGLSGDDDSVTGGLLGALTLVLLNGLFGLLSSRSTKLEELIEGTAVLVGRDGQILKDALRRQRVGEGDMQKALREADCELEQMARAYLEADGQITVLKKKKKT